MQEEQEEIPLSDNRTNNDDDSSSISTTFDLKQSRYYFYDVTNGYIKRVICVCIQPTSNNFEEDLQDIKQKQLGNSYPFRFGVSIYQNDKKYKNLRLKQIRKQLFETASGRLNKRPLFCYLCNPKQHDEYRFQLRTIIRYKPLHFAPRLSEE